MNTLYRFFVRVFIRTDTIRTSLGNLSTLIMYVSERQSALEQAVRAAISSRTQLVLPKQIAFDGWWNIRVSCEYNQQDPSRMKLTVTTTLDKPDHLLVEMLRQAMLEGAGFRGNLYAEINDNGRRGYILAVDGVGPELAQEYRLAVK